MEAAVDDPTRNHQGRRDDDGDRREGRVVVGVDGSLGSLGALRRAVAEARRLGRQLCTVRVVRPERLGHGLVSLGLVSVDDQEVAALYQQINLAYEEALGGVPGDVKTHSVVMVGTPGQALVSYARYEDDLLVVGAGGQRRWRRRWPGSVSGYCVRHARCPVLTVPLAEFARTMQRARLPRRRTGLEELLDA
jgi:nucleotide-binding universal stress UspA family protein